MDAPKTAREYVNSLESPDVSMQSEYRAIYDLLESVAANCEAGDFADADCDQMELIASVLLEVRETAEKLLSDLRAASEPWR